MPERIKDEHTTHNHMLDGLTDNTRSFYNELSTYFPNVKITSGKRSPGQKIGKAYRTSHHNTGSAIDISAKNYEVYNFLMNTKEGLGLLNKYNFGAYDETNPDNLEKTGGTAIHIHLGQDTALRKTASERLQNFDKGIEPVYAFITPKEKRNLNFQAQLNTQPNIANTQPNTASMQPMSYNNIPFQIESAVVQPAFANFEYDLQKEQVKEQKIQESPARQALEAKRLERDSIMKAFEQVQYKASTQQQQPQYSIPEVQLPDVQQSLPNLPNLFSFQ